MNQEIKRGLNIYLYYWTVVALLVFLVINVFSEYLKIPNINLDTIDLMISVVSFLFGFLISISFSMILTRVSALKESLAIETGRLVSLFLLSKHLGKEFNDKIKEKIDDYTISTLSNYGTYESGREMVYGISDDLKYMELKDKKQTNIANSFLYILGEFEPTRERLEYLTSGKLLWATKAVNYTLGGLLIFLLFLNRGTPFTNVMFILLSSIVAFILLIIEDYENLRIGDYIANISNSEQLFDLIEKERYYPEKILSRVKLEEGRKYRVGVYDKAEKKEKIFVLTYNSHFSSRLKYLINKFNIARRFKGS